MNTGDRRPVPETAKEIARAAAKAFGGVPEVRRYYDAKEAVSLDILSCGSTPMPGWTSYSTIGVSDCVNLLEGEDIRVEIAAVGPQAESRFSNFIGDIGLRVVKDQWLAAPGVVFPWVARDAQLSDALPHAFLASPSPWPELGAVRLAAAAREVHWLLALPISAMEYAWLLEHGFFEFERLLEERNVQYFDVGRESVV